MQPAAAPPEKPPAAVAQPAVAPPAAVQPAPAPAPAAEPARTQVAALDPALLKTAKPQPVDDAADDDKRAPDLAAAPLPPRRPADLSFALAFAPLPPARPPELSALSFASAQPGLRRDPIADILTSSRGTTTAARGATAAKTDTAKTDTVPARLDRSNFRAMSGSQPAERMTTQTGLGPSMVALRSAARAQTGVLTNAPAPGAGRFDVRPNDPPASGFSPARQRAALTGAPKAN
jgi:hypothetical protein